MSKQPQGELSFRERTVGAGIWSLTGVLGRTLVSSLVFVILARALGPDVFGMVGMVLVISNFAMVFLEAGFTAALIQKKDVDERHFSSVFWLNLVMGTAMAILFAVCAPLIAKFYNKPELIPLTIYLAAIFVIASFNMVQKSQITRELDLRFIAISELASTVIAGIIAIIMAYSGFGVWSIATQAIVSAATVSVFFWYFSSWRPRFVFDLSAIRELLQFSANYLATNSLNYWVRNLDNILIGKFLGDTMLGIYSRAYQLMLLPVQNFSASMSRVLFPSFSKIQEQHERISSIYLRACRVISLLSFPMMFGLCAVAFHLISAVLGEEWMDMVPVLRILCFVGAIQSISQLIGSLYMSQGRTDLQFRVTFLLRLLLIVGIVVGLRWGINGVAIGYLTAVLLTQYPNFHFAGGLIGLKFSIYVKNLGPTFFAALAMSMVVIGFAWVIDGKVADWIATCMEVLLGVAIYGVIVQIFQIRAFTELRDLAAERGVRIPFHKRGLMNTR